LCVCFMASWLLALFWGTLMFCSESMLHLIDLIELHFWNRKSEHFWQIDFVRFLLWFSIILPSSKYCWKGICVRLNVLHTVFVRKSCNKMLWRLSYVKITHAFCEGVIYGSKFTTIISFWPDLVIAPDVWLMSMCIVIV